MRKIFTILAAALLSATTMQAEVVFNEEHNVGSWNAQQLPVSNYEVLAKASAGDIIAITVTAVDEAGRICLQNMAWGGLGYDAYNVTAGVYSFVLTAEAANEIKTNGLTVTGEKYTFNKVELLYQKTIWTGEVDATTDWVQSDELNNAIFADLKTGDMLGVTVSKINENTDGWHSYALRVNWETNVAEGWISTAGTFVHALSADDVELLQGEAPVVVLARYLTVTAIHTYLASKSVTPTAIDQTAEPGRGIKVIRDGQLYIVRDDKTYTLQGQLIK